MLIIVDRNTNMSSNPARQLLWSWREILSKYTGEIYLPVVVAGVDINLELVLLLVVDRHPACGVPCCTEWDNPVIGPRDAALLMPL